MKPTPEKYCLYCGILLERKRFNGRLEDLTVFNKRKYCSRDCMSKNHLKIEHKGKSWSSSHATARNINNLILMEYVCESCGKDGKLDIHHKDLDYQNNNLDNLMSLCRSCHMKLHKEKGFCIICGNPVKGLGYCDKHYQRFKKYGNPLMTKQRSCCKICGEPAQAKQLCGKHYQKMKRDNSLELKS